MEEFKDDPQRHRTYAEAHSQIRAIEMWQVRMEEVLKSFDKDDGDCQAKIIREILERVFVAVNELIEEAEVEDAKKGKSPTGGAGRGRGRGKCLKKE